MKSKLFVIGALALVVCVAGTHAFAAGPTPKSQFYNLGNGWEGSDVSPTGGYATGTADTGQCFVWTETGGVMLTNARGSNCSISDFGAAMAGTLNNGKNNAAYSSDGGASFAIIGPGGGWTGCGSSMSNTYDITGDGQTVVGLGWPNCGSADAFKWDSTNGMQLLDNAAQENPARATRANGAGADDSCIVGWADSPFGYRQGAIWRNGVMELVYDDEGDRIGEAQGASSDCSYVVGNGNRGEGAWILNPDGSMDRMGLFGQQVQGKMSSPHSDFAIAVSDDGERVVGMNLNNDDGTRVAWIWHRSDGKTEELRKYLHTTGAKEVLNWWSLMVPRGMSADGTMISGFGLDQFGVPTGFVATTAAP